MCVTNWMMGYLASLRESQVLLCHAVLCYVIQKSAHGCCFDGTLLVRPVIINETAQSRLCTPLQIKNAMHRLQALQH